MEPLSDDVVPPWVENIRPYIGLQEKRDNKKLPTLLRAELDALRTRLG